ncbi:MAG TPA: MFS transporter [Woeseiaceae bacterium]|nr:MFS transporter [Woeseiaceae bacterium]
MSKDQSTKSAASLISDIVDNGNISAYQIFVVALCVVFNMLDGFDIAAMAVVAEAVSREFQLTPAQLGWVFSSALAGMMFGAMFIAPFADRYGRRKLIVASLTLVAVSMAVTSYAAGVVSIAALRFVSGAGAGAVIACQVALAAEFSTTRLRTLAVTAVMSGYPLGAMLTSVVAAQLMPTFGWRGMFWFGGIATLLMAVIAWFALPESLKFLLERQPGTALTTVNRILNRMGRTILSALPPVEKRPQEPGSASGNGMSVLMRNDLKSVTVTLWTVFFLCFATLYFLMSWIPKLMIDAGFEIAVGRTAFLVFNFGGFLGIFLIGILATKWHLTTLIFLLLMAAAACMFAFAIVPHELGLMLIITFATGVFLQGGFSGLYAVAAKAYPTALRSTGIGWAMGLGRSGAVVGPALAGYLIAAGLGMSASYLVFAVPTALGALLAYRLKIG